MLFHVSKAVVKLLNICWFDILSISALLNKSKEVVGKSNDVELVKMLGLLLTFLSQ